MRRFTVRCCVFALVTSMSVAGSAQNAKPGIVVINGRVVASGIPGAGAVSSVGVFHAGGPIHDNAAFAAFTAPGRVLDPSRLLVTSTSNFGSPPMAGMPEGSVLSIDTNGPAVRVPATFASTGGQASALDGRVQLFTAASATFANGINTPKAVTAELPAVSNPLGISINNAFGRLWFPSTPSGLTGAGFESIIDPTGLPLANAPNKTAGGVFTDVKTNRSPQLVPGGMTTALVANALLGESPDGSKRAVFAVLGADGSLTQAHTEVGVDGLAPRGTITPQNGKVTRAGMILNWVPNRTLYITDGARNAVVAIPIGDDTHVFRAGQPRAITNVALHRPIDIAPAVPEIANGVFSSNTTLAGNSDMYVLNADGTLVRMRQDGTVIAVRRVSVGGDVIGAGRLSGIASSSDAARLWVTLRDATGTEPAGAVIELPAFGASVVSAPASLAARAGKVAFSRTFTPQMGLGPLFNERSCIGCHLSPSPGGTGRDGLAVVTRVARLDAAFNALVNEGGPVARMHSVSELGFACALAPGVPATANVTSIRNTLPLYDDGAIDAMNDAMIADGAIAFADGVHGRPNWVASDDGTTHVGRFGWKGAVAQLNTFVAEAFRNELGVTNPLFPHDLVGTRAPRRPCQGEHTALEDDGTLVRVVSAFVAALKAPATASQQTSDAPGISTFAALGCAECHASRLRVGSESLYSDLLVHDMGPALDDGFVQASAQGHDWRTMPLHGIHMRHRFLHDGRAQTLADAILAHDGEAAPAVQKYRALDPAAQQVLLTFVQGL